MEKAAILLIYTGGTIGMVEDFESKALIQFDFQNIEDQVPELSKINADISSVSFKQPIDSSDMCIEHWNELVSIIKLNYDKHDGFVVLHGSDTMSYTASALSFMLKGLSKPVILTGSQLPIGTIRTDGKENLITAIEIASARENGLPVVPEVGIYFEYDLYRGNRTSKINTEDFEAFNSFNYPKLAEAGVEIKYNKNAIHRNNSGQLDANCHLDENVTILKLFPGITKETIKAVLNIPDLKGVVLETYGAGNATTRTWFLEELKTAIDRGVFIFNVSQCLAGSVVQGKYDTGLQLEKLGVISGSDITTEAAITKLMYVLGKYNDRELIIEKLSTSLAGELSEGQ